MNFKSFDVMYEVIDEASERFAATHKVNQEKLEEFRRCSLALDKVIEEIDGDCFEVEIDEDEKTIRASVECDYAFVEECKQLYRDLIGATVSFGFVPVSDGMMSIEFVFTGVWDKI